MRLGDRVIRLKDPLEHGVGVINRVQPNGEILVSFDRPDEQTLELLYVATELELEDAWLASCGCDPDVTLWFEGEAA
jgi:hypothetical protein